MNLREFKRILRQTLLFPVFLLLVLAGFIIWQITQSTAELRALDHSDDVTEEVLQLEKLIIDQETGLRGYQLTGDPAMLAPFRTAGPLIPVASAERRSRKTWTNSLPSDEETAHPRR